MKSDQPTYRAEEFQWGGEELQNDGRNLMSRRNFGRLSVGLFTLGLGGAAASTLGSQPALATSHHEEWIAQGANIESDDGNVEEITFGDPEDGGGSYQLGVSWEGFDDDENDAEFDVEMRGSEDDEDTDGWTGDQADYDSIIPDDTPDTVSLEGSSGEESYDWDDIFGEPRPGDVLEHVGFDDLSSFEQADDGETRTRTLDVKVTVDVPDQDISAEAEDTATIEVSNREATIAIGGEGGFVINLD